MADLDIRESPLADLSACEREPIHIPGAIQPHGALLALDESFQIIQASENSAALLGWSGRTVRGLTLEEGLGRENARSLADGMARSTVEATPISLGRIQVQQTFFNALAHRYAGALILELELAPPSGGDSPNLYPLVRQFLNEIQEDRPIEQLVAVAALEVRRLCGFDRVLIYRFEEDWSGTVIAEERNDKLPSYFDLRFPESDIPRQARDLYRLNRIRLICDANYKPVAITPVANPITGRPLDLSYSFLRSVSPVHIEYMQNMGTLASMSLSIVENGKLWGLISCHHHAPFHVGLEIRTACEFLAEILSTQIASSRQRANAERRIALQICQNRLMNRMAEKENFVDSIVEHPVEMLDCVQATGAAVVFEGRCDLIGQTPAAEEVAALVKFISSQPNKDVFATNALESVFPEASQFKNTASGVLAISISQFGAGYLLWFLPELVNTVKWAGEPAKPVEVEAGAPRIHPRRSFELWKQTVEGQSRRWDSTELDSIADFRNAVISIVLRKAQELAALTSELKRSNSELEAFSYSVSHDLRAPFRHIVGYSELLKSRETALSADGRRYLDTIIESAHFAGALVDHLLNFSQIGRTSLHRTVVQVKRLVEELVSDLQNESADREIEWRIGDLPNVTADLFLFRVVLDNLIRNAIKYTRTRTPAVIEIGSRTEDGSLVFWVRDNGVGFDMQYVGKLFGVFQRLHRIEEFEGTGIGLATVRRIVERHGGETWAEGETDAGATFYFSLPLAGRAA